MIRRIVLIISFILISISLALMFRSERKIVLERNKISNTITDMVSYKYNDDIYDAILSIPLINLKKGIYSINDKRNNISENIMIDRRSVYPDKDNSNIIFIAHSGVGEKAYFKNLKYLDSDSLIEFYYNHIKYVYKIDNYYTINKSSDVEVKYDKSKKTITLITCSDKNNRTIYIGYLIDEIKY